MLSCSSSASTNIVFLFLIKGFSFKGILFFTMSQLNLILNGCDVDDDDVMSFERDDG